MSVTKPVIGVVGGIGAGKSTAAAALARRGGRVVAADPAGHAALRDPANLAVIAKRWPDTVGEDGQIDRKLLGRVVFGDPSQLKELESIVFPWIAQRIKREIDEACSDPDVRFIVLDAAVMLEAGMRDLCTQMVYVDAPHGARAGRVAGRGWSVDDLDRRERSQWDLAEKRKLADAVLDNGAGPDELQRRADELLTLWGLMPS